MNDDKKRQLQDQQCKESDYNELSRYSTTQLKKELRRRKNER